MADIDTQTRVTASIEQLVNVVQSLVAEASSTVKSLRAAYTRDPSVLAAENAARVTKPELILRTSSLHEPLEQLLDDLRARRPTILLLSREQQSDALAVMHCIQLEVRHALADAQCLCDEIDTELALRPETALSKIVIMRQAAQRNIDSFERRLSGLISSVPTPHHPSPRVASLPVPPKIEFSSDEQPSPQPSPQLSPLPSRYKSEPGQSPRARMYGSDCGRSYVTSPGAATKHVPGNSRPERDSPMQLFAEDMDEDEEETEFEVSFSGVRSKQQPSAWTPPRATSPDAGAALVVCSSPRLGARGSPEPHTPQPATPRLSEGSPWPGLLTLPTPYGPGSHGTPPSLLYSSPPAGAGASLTVPGIVLRGGSTEDTGSFQVQGSLTVRRRTRIRGKRGKKNGATQLAASLAVPLIAQAYQQNMSTASPGLGLSHPAP
ncbi:hypothetical protein BKA62DRAFT_715198 [Auriculariales sp. MPI-PUGE-AT-0066]|nr:hypothetical protein BKA62DRAFT_715198 [Auriculariales sp. MPI-PUGE-AT-0066]